MSRFLSVIVALTLLLTGCAPMMKLSPREETLILLPQNSTASITGHFQKEERHTYWLLQGFSGTLPSPTDILARAAGSRPVRNASISATPDWLLFALKFIGAIGAGTALAATPGVQPVAPWAYMLIIFGVPEATHYRVEGDFADGPSDLGKGR